MQEEIILILVKEDDIYIEVFSGTEEEHFGIEKSIKDLFDNREIKEIKVSKEDYMSCKNDINKLQELYNK